MAQARGYQGTTRPQLADLDRCTRCGLCEQACPTYRLEHFEPDSPRGRIFLMKQVAEGRADIDEHLAEHLYRCLGCRACESACPSGVPFGRLLEAGRYQVEMRGDLAPGRGGWPRFRSIAFERVLPTRWLFRALMAPAQWLQRIPGALALARTLPLPRRWTQLVRMLPPSVERAPSDGSVVAAQGERRARVGLFVGCVMGSLFGHVHAATARVLARNGCDVVIVPGQWCCGALNVHAGERDAAARMARANIAAFAGLQLDAIVVNSAGCGAVMKEYPELLAGDAAASDFSRKVKDVNEFLAELGLRPGLRRLGKRMTYQDACHLAHGQHIRQQPRELLRQIPGCELVEMSQADRCCGAAGVYSLTHPETASRVLAEKLDSLVATGAQVVATANPGCAMQLQAGILDRRLDVTVRHVVELLDEAYAEGP
jgi:glycolate oxidase iron-sulfur subunit